MPAATVQLTKEEIATMRAEVDQKGHQAVADGLDVDQQTVFRVVSGARVRKDTARFVRQYLASTPKVECR